MLQETPLHWSTILVVILTAVGALLGILSKVYSDMNTSKNENRKTALETQKTEANLTDTLNLHVIEWMNEARKATEERATMQASLLEIQSQHSTILTKFAEQAEELNAAKLQNIQLLEQNKSLLQELAGLKQQLAHLSARVNEEIDK